MAPSTAYRRFPFPQGEGYISEKNNKFSTSEFNCRRPIYLKKMKQSSTIIKPSPGGRSCAAGEGALFFPYSEAKASTASKMPHHLPTPKTSLRSLVPDVYDTANSPERAVCKADRNHSLCGIRNLTVRSPKGKFQAPRRGDDSEANAERGGRFFFRLLLLDDTRRNSHEPVKSPFAEKSKVLVFRAVRPI